MDNMVKIFAPTFNGCGPEVSICNQLSFKGLCFVIFMKVMRRDLPERHRNR
ncbi:hypothetical protein ABIE13_000417 [Ottowia thiooxydans]|uniref:Uncharacterized protein n=1 Tax=Ottowia thiooxydans TaxID=219182 RepID=A0ABV2Q2S2_9BURK